MERSGCISRSIRWRFSRRSETLNARLSSRGEHNGQKSSEENRDARGQVSNRRAGEEGGSLRYFSVASVFLGVVAAASCKDSSPRVAKTEPVIAPRDSIADWARRVDSLADSAHARGFTSPGRSTEGGEGRFYLLADSSVRVDVDDYGEMGRSRARFYARGTALRLSVSTEERYDQPMSGNVVKTTIDSTWFLADTAVKWRDSVGVVRVQRDSLLQAHGRQVMADYASFVTRAKAAGQPRRR